MTFSIISDFIHEDLYKRSVCLMAYFELRNIKCASTNTGNLMRNYLNGHIVECVRSCQIFEDSFSRKRGVV